MNKKFTVPFALTLAAVALVGCSSNKTKVEEIKPNKLPKIVQAKTLVPVFSEHVTQTNKNDPLRLQMGADNGVIFLLIQKVMLKPTKANSAFGQPNSPKNMA
jgi:outer membrane protein assembly factor BamB